MNKIIKTKIVKNPTGRTFLSRISQCIAHWPVPLERSRNIMAFIEFLSTCLTDLCLWESRWKKKQTPRYYHCKLGHPEKLEPTLSKSQGKCLSNEYVRVQ